MVGGTSGRCIDHPRRGLPVSKRKTSTDPGRGLVAWISNEDGPPFPVVGEDLPCLAAQEVVASRVEAVRPLEFIDQRNRVVGIVPDCRAPIRTIQMTMYY